MSVGLLGNKIGMTQIFDESGNIIPVTILKVGPCTITQIKTKSKDGYDSIQVGYGNVSNKALTQPELGHLQKSNIQPLKYLKEFRVNETDTFEIGQILNVESFSPGQLVNIRGKSIGKGFSGLQKRHNLYFSCAFCGFPALASVIFASTVALLTPCSLPLRHHKCTRWYPHHRVHPSFPSAPGCTQCRASRSLSRHAS